MDNLRKSIIAWASLIGLIAVAFLWSEFFLPLNPTSSKIIDFTIEKGQGASQISRALKDQGMIKHSSMFRVYALITGRAEKLQAGQYELFPSMSIAKLVKKFSRGDVKKEKITILEGWDLRNIGDYFESLGICSKDEFLVLAKKDFSQDLAILEDKPSDSTIEGYLFPDTYEISLDIGAEDIIKKILGNFDKKLTIELEKEILRQKKTVFDIITMASLIENEVKSMEDKKIVSGLLWKRIKIGMPLQVDATVLYLTKEEDREVTYDDLKIDSPYNTYKYYGLPKGPISNPGLDSIVAAIYPTETNYLYYLTGLNGKTFFSKTFAEHAAAIRKYLR